jgi:hypothetical protein
VIAAIARRAAAAALDALLMVVAITVIGLFLAGYVLLVERMGVAIGSWL